MVYIHNGILAIKRMKLCHCSNGDGDAGSITGSGRSSGVGNGNPFQYSCLEKSHGQGSLVGYSPYGCKEVDTTE